MGFYDDLLDPTHSGSVADSMATGSSSPAPAANTTPTPAGLESFSTGAETKPLIGETITNESDSTGEESEDNTHNAGAVPDTITSRPANTELRPRFDGHAAFNNMVREDWITAIKLNPDRFDALLFRAMSPTDVSIDEDGYEATDAQKIAPNQETLVYADPELVAVVDCPDEMADFYAMNDTDENAGVQDDALILRVAAHDITIGSILEWLEEQASGESIRRWWYVHRKFSYGTAAVGTLYYCVPSRTYEGLLNE